MLKPKAKNPSNPASKKTRTHDHEYHVVWNSVRRRWDIERDGGFAGSFAQDKSTAIGLAVREAQRDAHQGLDVVVCVQQKDGSFLLEWSSP